MADDRVAADGNLQHNVSDGIHYISMFTGDGNTLVDELYYGVSCGEPAARITAACDDDEGGIHVILAPGTEGGSFELYVEDFLVENDLETSPSGNTFTSFPDGTYDVGIKWSGQAQGYLFEETVTTDCLDGSIGQPATATVETFCDDPTIGVDLESFTYGETFTITIDDAVEYSGVYAEWYEVGVTSGAHHVRVTSSTDGIIYDDIVLLACGGPAVAARAECASEGSGELFVKTLAEKEYSFSVSVDGQPVADWQEVADTSGEWQSLGEFSEGPHTVLIEWLVESEVDGSEEVLVDSDCNDDTSGTPLPDSGSNSTPLVLAAGLLVAAGLGLLGLRRRTA